MQNIETFCLNPHFYRQKRLDDKPNITDGLIARNGTFFYKLPRQDTENAKKQRFISLMSKGILPVADVLEIDRNYFSYGYIHDIERQGAVILNDNLSAIDKDFLASVNYAIAILQYLTGDVDHFITPCKNMLFYRSANNFSFYIFDFDKASNLFGSAMSALDLLNYIAIEKGLGTQALARYLNRISIIWNIPIDLHRTEAMINAITKPVKASGVSLLMRASYDTQKAILGYFDFFNNFHHDLAKREFESFKLFASIMRVSKINCKEIGYSANNFEAYLKVKLAFLRLAHASLLVLNR